MKPVPDSLEPSKMWCREPLKADYNLKYYTIALHRSLLRMQMCRHNIDEQQMSKLENGDATTSKCGEQKSTT